MATDIPIPSSTNLEALGTKKKKANKYYLNREIYDSYLRKVPAPLNKGLPKLFAPDKKLLVDQRGKEDLVPPLYAGAYSKANHTVR